jgi:eukaryotic-like serine/threonine-protein kinase
MKLDFSKKYNSSTLGGLLIHILVAASIIFLLALSYFYLYLPGATNHGETITVPSVEGKVFSEAAKFLEDHDLRYEISDSSYSAEYPPLTVLKQIPSPYSKVKEQRKIYLSINRVTPPSVPLPNLIESSLINAEALLKGSELRRGKIQLVRGPFLNYVQEMRIKGVKVVPGVRVPKGTIVDLVVMDGGSTTLPTPDVIGLSLEDSKISIFGSNLSIGKVTLVTDTVGVKAVILKQNPVPQENIQVGDVVDLWIGEEGTDLSEDGQIIPDEGGNNDL